MRFAPSAVGLVLALASGLATGQSLPVPSAAQLNAFKHNFTLFMHFGLCTYHGCQWDIPINPAESFQPDSLDTDSWAEAALAAGASQICLTVRHVDGFSLWPTASTNYSVSASTWRNGTGDVVADFVASMKKYQLSTCFYIILGFNVYANKTGVPGDIYLEQQVTALTELLTQYGPVDRLWWDNYALDGSVYQPVTHEGFVCPNNIINSTTCPAWQTLIDTVRRLSPTTAIVPGPDGCLVNGESYGGTYPIYHATGMVESGYWCSGGASTLTSGENFVVVESDFSILNPGDNWFWAPSDPYLNASSIMAQFTVKHDNGATLIFNVPPNSSGVIPAEYVSALSAFAAQRAATFAAAAATLPAPVSAACADLSFTLPVSGPFDVLFASEGMSAGQVVGGYSVEAFFAANASWAALPVLGVTVGGSVRDVLPWTVSGASRIRWNCTKDLTPPPPVQFTNAAGQCLATPNGSAFPCWTGQGFSLCPLVAADCAGAGAAAVWSAPPGAAWSTPHLPEQPTLNLDCNNCVQGTIAKLIAGDSNPFTYSPAAGGGQILIDGCPGMCLSNGIAAGAHASCAGTEPWFTTQVHVDDCAAASTQGWTQAAAPTTAARPGGGKLAAAPATIASFGAYMLATR